MSPTIIADFASVAIIATILIASVLTAALVVCFLLILKLTYFRFVSLNSIDSTTQLPEILDYYSHTVFIMWIC